MSEIEQIWPEWHVEELIGQSPYSKVYKASRFEAGAFSYAAIKVIHIPVSGTNVGELSAMGMGERSIAAYYEQVTREVMGEIATMESLRGCENLVAVLDSVCARQPDGIGWTVCIRMELLETLTEHIRSIGRLPIAEVVTMGIQLCRALEACHAKGVFHHDVRPENVFWCQRNGTYKLGDIGIAEQLASRMQSVRTMAGPQDYMAPEVARGDTYSSNADVYALGLMLYRYLNDMCPPFLSNTSAPLQPNDVQWAQTRRLRGEALPAPANADARLAAVILKACDPDPAARYVDATAFRRALEAWMQPSVDDMQGNGGAGRATEPVRERANRTALLAPLAACVLAIALVAFGVLGSRNGTGGASDSGQGNAPASSGMLLDGVTPRDDPDDYSWDEFAAIADALSAADSKHEFLEICEAYGITGSRGTLSRIEKDIELSDGTVLHCKLVDAKCYTGSLSDEVYQTGLTFFCWGKGLKHQYDSRNGVTWSESDLRSWLNNDVIEMLPEDLSRNIVLSCVHGGTAPSEGALAAQRGLGDADDHGSDDYLWLPSARELGGEVDFDWPSNPSNKAMYDRQLNEEGRQFTFFSGVDSEWFDERNPERVSCSAKSNDEIATGYYYWLRSVAPSTSRPLAVSDNGNIGYAIDAERKLGVAFCFNLGDYVNEAGEVESRRYPDPDDFWE